jgi:hypothetical protein
MKSVALFILCLFFILLKGSEPAHATGHDTLRSYSAALHIDGQDQPRSLNMRLAMLPLRNHNISDKKESLSIDFDDDDVQEDFLVVRKYMLPITYFFTLASLSIFNLFYSHTKNRLPFCTHFSYTSSRKYILQRVLRI